MSYFYTKQQILDGTKDVTRRNGWRNLKPDEHYTGVEKAQGLKKGEKIKFLRQLYCVSNEPERLDEIIKRPMRPDQGWMPPRREVEREGFPNMTEEDFVEMFCKNMDVDPSDEIQRIRFGYFTPRRVA